MSNLKSPNLSGLVSYLLKTFQTLSSSKKVAVIVVSAVAAAVLLSLFTACGVTRTIVKTSGKGTTNASVSVTTNNPTSVDVSTQVDSIPVRISASRKSRR